MLILEPDRIRSQEGDVTKFRQHNGRAMVDQACEGLCYQKET